MRASESVRERIAVALDVSDLDRAVQLVEAVRPHAGVAKVGLELFSATGSRAVEAVQDQGMTVFLDVKLHDIPTTVNRAAAVLGRLGVGYLTVHAVGGAAMVRAAVDGLSAGADAAGLPAPTVLAVTVLTSDSHAPVELLRERLALAVEGGATGVICAAPDVPAIKSEVPSIVAVTPGIRPADTAAHDQARVATPATAIADGADVLVVGRAITAAGDPADAARRIAEEVRRAVEAPAGKP